MSYVEVPMSTSLSSMLLILGILGIFYTQYMMIFLNEHHYFLFKFHWSLFRGPIDNKHDKLALF